MIPPCLRHNPTLPICDMSRLYRKQTHKDFRARIKRVDPSFHRWGEGAGLRDTTVKRPVASVLTGFAWAYLVIAIASNRAHVEASLSRGTLSETLQSSVMAGLAALLAISGVMFCLHLYRYLFQSAGKKQNSGAMLIGVLGALVLVYTPDDVWRTGAGMIDNNSRTLLLTASAGVGDVLPGVDFTSVAFVSSLGK